MAKPLIGLTTGHQRNQEGRDLIYIPEAYVQAVSEAGAAPVLIPTGLSTEDLAEIATHVDGVLFTGGGDIRPHHYGASDEDPRALWIDDARDQMEFDLFNKILSKQLPFLGICRGLQVVNVALKGTLYIDITEEKPSDLVHQSGNNGHARDYLAHEVQVEHSSLLALILQSENLGVNSFHHQGIDQLAPRLVATAHAPDGLIEAVEMPAYPFGLAVQWHPECLQALEPMRKLFKAFVEATRRNPG